MEGCKKADFSPDRQWVAVSEPWAEERRWEAEWKKLLWPGAVALTPGTTTVQYTAKPHRDDCGPIPGDTSICWLWRMNARNPSMRISLSTFLKWSLEFVCLYLCVTVNIPWKHCNVYLKMFSLSLSDQGSNDIYIVFQLLSNTFRGMHFNIFSLKVQIVEYWIVFGKTLGNYWHVF